jgi:cohesin complex subunit SA-1/2
MSIYLVYCARHSTDKNGLPMPQVDLQISLPEQVQYRFAGYIETVIEQYAQELEASLDEEADQDSGSDVNSNDEGGETTKKKKRRQPKVLQEDGDEEDPLGSRLYCDYLTYFLTMLRRCSSHRPGPCLQGL